MLTCFLCSQEIDNILPPLCHPYWRSAKNQGAQSVKSALRSQFYGHCVKGQHVEPWAAGLEDPPQWATQPRAAARIVQIRREAALAVAMVGHETLLEMEAEYQVGVEYLMDVVKGTVNRLEGASAATEKTIIVNDYRNHRINEEYEIEKAVIVKRMSLLNNRAPTYEELLNPAKAIQERKRKSANAAREGAAVAKATALKPQHTKPHSKKRSSKRGAQGSRRSRKQGCKDQRSKELIWH